jgi:hypothetical protein
MSVALYDVSIPIFTLSLNNLAAILDKAASHADNKKVDPKALPATRLIVDMLPLSAQVQIACDTAKGAAARLAGVENPKHEDTEATISELKARVGKTLEFADPSRSVAGGRDAGRHLAIPWEHFEVQRSQLPHELRAAQFLLSRDDGVRAVAKQWRGARQTGLPRPHSMTDIALG